MTFRFDRHCLVLRWNITLKWQLMDFPVGCSFESTSISKRFSRCISLNSAVNFLRFSFYQLRSSVPRTFPPGSLNDQMISSVRCAVWVLAISKVSPSNVTTRRPLTSLSRSLETISTLCMRTYWKQDHYTTLLGAASGCYLRRLLRLGTSSS